MGSMSAPNFQNLIKISKNYIEAAKKKKINFNEILTGLYNDPSHFIYEILQNAEDAQATEVTFNLNKDELEIIHNGKDFSFDDVESITGIGLSTKRDDLNAIGKFGVGFKSVFAVTGTPIIHSGQYHIKIDDFVVPSVVSTNNKTDNTKITLPFNHSKRFKDEVFELVENKLYNIGLVTLLFLSNINEIQWQTPTKSGHYYKTSENFKDFKNIKSVSVISEKENKEFFEEYLVLNRPIELEARDLKIEIAYRISRDDSDCKVIVPMKNTKLVVFFPTEKVTYLSFLIQGPYKTTPNRENIPLDDEQNKKIIEETGNLVVESISIIKELGLLDIGFLNVLPILDDHKEDSIYQTIYEKVKQKFLSEENLLPTLDDNYTKTQEAILARRKDLTEFLSTQDIEFLFDRKHWLSTEITSADRTRNLRNYLVNELKIKEIDFEDFAGQISSDFLETKDDPWLIDFYSRLLEQRALWREKTHGKSQGVLRRRPIIRLLNNEHIEPFDADGKVQVYLPTETKSEYKTVKSSLTNDESSLEFLKELGLTTPDIFAELREFILPKYKKDDISIGKDEFLTDFEKILHAYDKVSPERKNQFISDLNNLHLIKSFRNKNNLDESIFLMPSEVYFRTPDLEEYFQGFDSIYFASTKLFKQFDKTKIESFLLEIGCEDKPRRFRVKSDLTSTEKEKIREQNFYSEMTYEIETIDYDYEGLNNFTAHISEQNSCFLWKLLLKNLATCGYWKEDFFKGVYKWMRHGERSEKFDSAFLRTLKNNAWLVDVNGDFRLPSEITLSDLADDYNQQDDNKDALASVLGFQSDEIKIIEQKTGGKFIPKEDVSEYEQWKVEKAQKELPEQADKWQPEVEPDEVETNIYEVEPEIVETPDLSYQGSHGKTSKDDLLNNETDSAVATSATASEGLKIVGDWGEAHVYKALRDRFANDTYLEETKLGFNIQSSDGKLIEIKWLNKDRDTGKGYDLVISSDGIEIEYIEVKSKRGSEKELIQITGTQWEFARHLFENGEGEKYQIYVVNNAGLKNVSIRKLKNPIRLWKEGKLYAHPINFKI